MRFFRLLMIGALMLSMAAPAFAGKQTRARKRDGSCTDPYASGTVQPSQSGKGSQQRGQAGQCDQTQRRARDGSCQK